MPKLYNQNGTGRDSYIFSNNGGFYPPLEKLHTQIPEHLWYGTGSPTRKSNQGKTLPR